jgi:hypothetical protein
LQGSRVDTWRRLPAAAQIEQQEGKDVHRIGFETQQEDFGSKQLGLALAATILRVDTYDTLQVVGE